MSGAKSTQGAIFKGAPTPYHPVEDKDHALVVCSPYLKSFFVGISMTVAGRVDKSGGQAR